MALMYHRASLRHCRNKTIPGQAMQNRPAVPGSAAGQGTIPSIRLPPTRALPVLALRNASLRSASRSAAAVQAAASMQASPQYERLQGSMVRALEGAPQSPRRS